MIGPPWGQRIKRHIFIINLKYIIHDDLIIRFIFKIFILVEEY